MAETPIIVIGAGIGGLAAGMLLAARGERVLILEKQSAPGGKMRLVSAGGAEIDGGPTVFTMRAIFDALFEAAGTSLGAELTLTPLDVLARHSWCNGPELDLFADLDRSADAIGAFAGADAAQGYYSLTREAKHMYETLRKAYIEKQRPSPFDVAFGAGLSGVIALMKINPFETLWQAVSRHLKDPRLQQLFGRYATYVGSSPYQAVATLLLIAHVEQEGVWTVQGGMHAVARAFERVFKNKGGSIRYETSVRRIVTSGDRVRAVITVQGEEIPCRAVISNADANAIATGHFGDDVSHVVQELNKADRSLSAITWCSHAHTSGFPLAFHNVFFSKDYKREFEMLRQSYPPDPTTYICAQDRNGVVQDKERLLILINSPANGDSLEKNRDMIEQAMRKKLNECGLQVDWSTADTTITSPQGFHALFPATGGALYGRSSHGFYASFKRPGAKTKIPGLFLAGGSAHPGAGVPMAAYSGRLAADAVMDFLSSPSHHKGARFMQGES